LPRKRALLWTKRALSWQKRALLRDSRGLERVHGTTTCAFGGKKGLFHGTKGLFHGKERLFWRQDRALLAAGQDSFARSEKALMRNRVHGTTTCAFCGKAMSLFVAREGSFAVRKGFFCGI